MHSVWSGMVYICIALKHLLWSGHLALVSCPNGYSNEIFVNAKKYQDVDAQCSVLISLLCNKCAHLQWRCPFTHMSTSVFLSADEWCLMKTMSTQTNKRKWIKSAHLTPSGIFKLPPAPGERSHPFCCFSFSEANLCQSAHILEYVSYSIIHNMYSTHVTLYTRC